MPVKLNDKSKRSIEKKIGLSISDISSMDVKDLDSHIEKKIGKKLKYRLSRNPYLIGRGSIYLFLGRLLDLFYVEKRLSKIS